MGQAEDIVQLICPHEDIELGEEWVRITAECDASFSVHITLDRDCRKLNLMATKAEVQALLSEKSAIDDGVIQKDSLFNT